MAKENKDLLQALNNYANRNYQKNFTDIKNDNLFYDKKGNVLRENNLDKHQNDKMFIAIKDDEAIPVYLDNEPKTSKADSSYNDREPLKWYKLIIAAFYAIFKAIKELIGVAFKLVQKRNLNNALKKAKTTNFKAKKEKEREEVISKKQEVIEKKSLESEKDDLKKESLKEINKTQEIKEINKAQIEREKELNQIRKNLKSFDRDAHNKETELKKIKDNLIKIDMAAVEERVRLARLKGIEPQNKYQKAVNKSSHLFERMDMIDLILHNKGYKDDVPTKPKEEKKTLKSNPYRRAIEVEELKNEVSPIERIFNNLNPVKENKLTK